MSSQVFAGDTSGSITIQAPAVAGTGVLTLPENITGTLATRITSGTSQASTSGTAISFTGIPSWVKRITVMLNGVSTSGTSIVQIQIGSGTYTTSGYTGSAAVAFDANTPAVVNMSTGFLLSGGVLASYSLRGSVTLNLLSSQVWTISGVIGQSDSTRINWCGGAVTLGGVLDILRVTTVNGTDTFDAGSINILYE